LSNFNVMQPQQQQMRMQKILTENSSCLDLQRDTSKRTKLSSLCKEEAQQCCRNCYFFCCAISCQTTNSLEITPTLIWQDWILMKNYRGSSSSSKSMMTTRTFDLTSWKKILKKISWPLDDRRRCMKFITNGKT
jgi:hypothetical protein